MEFDKDCCGNFDGYFWAQNRVESLEKRKSIGEAKRTSFEITKLLFKY
jgi:hypothetical protein